VPAASIVALMMEADYTAQTTQKTKYLLAETYPDRLVSRSEWGGKNCSTSVCCYIPATKVCLFYEGTKGPCLCLRKVCRRSQHRMNRVYWRPIDFRATEGIYYYLQIGMEKSPTSELLLFCAWGWSMYVICGRCSPDCTCEKEKKVGGQAVCGQRFWRASIGDFVLNCRCVRG
jgi:hypothetical protein